MAHKVPLEPLTLRRLRQAVARDSAIRRTLHLQPANGLGAQILPPTYPVSGPDEPPRYVYGRRRDDHDDGWYAVVHSVRGEAKRLKQVLREVADDDARPPIPCVSVHVATPGLSSLERITSIDAPHGVYDAVVRNALLDGVPFMQSGEGRRLAAATKRDATAVLELAPSALVFGAWNSDGEDRGQGPRFARVLVSEMIAVDTLVDEVVTNEATGETEPRTASRGVIWRNDPTGIKRSIGRLAGDMDWTHDGAPARPEVVPMGVSCAYVELLSVITLAGVRGLAFGTPARDRAGRTLLAAMVLLAVCEGDAQGYFLRSGCLLVPDGIARCEIVHRDGGTEVVAVDRETAQSVYRDAFAQAEAAGFGFKWLTLKPQAQSGRDRSAGCGEADPEYVKHQEPADELRA